MIADLPAFIADYGARPHEWSVVDCSIVLADWGLANGYPDVAAHLRGTYATAEGCRAVIEAAGGVLALVTGCAATAGLDAIARPEPGAVGVIGAAGNIYRQWGAIFDGAGWQVRLGSGFVAVKAAPIGVWRI